MARRRKIVTSGAARRYAKRAPAVISDDSTYNRDHVAWQWVEELIRDLAKRQEDIYSEWETLFRRRREFITDEQVKRVANVTKQSMAAWTTQVDIYSGRPDDGYAWESMAKLRKQVEDTHLEDWYKQAWARGYESSGKPKTKQGAVLKNSDVKRIAQTGERLYNAQENLYNNVSKSVGSYGPDEDLKRFRATKEHTNFGLDKLQAAHQAGGSGAMRMMEHRLYYRDTDWTQQETDDVVSDLRKGYHDGYVTWRDPVTGETYSRYVRRWGTRIIYGNESKTFSRVARLRHNKDGTISREDPSLIKRKESIVQYGRAFLRKEAAEMYNYAFINGAIKAAEDEGKNPNDVMVRVFDGPDCGWTSHEDEAKANGMVVSLLEARRYPLAHPHCRRQFYNLTKPGGGKEKQKRAKEIQSRAQGQVERRKTQSVLFKVGATTLAATGTLGAAWVASASVRSVMETYKIGTPIKKFSDDILRIYPLYAEWQNKLKAAKEAYATAMNGKRFEKIAENVTRIVHPREGQQIIAREIGDEQMRDHTIAAINDFLENGTTLPQWAEDLLGSKGMNEDDLIQRFEDFADYTHHMVDRPLADKLLEEQIAAEGGNMFWTGGLEEAEAQEVAMIRFYMSQVRGVDIEGGSRTAFQTLLEYWKTKDLPTTEKNAIIKLAKAINPFPIMSQDLLKGKIKAYARIQMTTQGRMDLAEKLWAQWRDAELTARLEDLVKYEDEFSAINRKVLTLNREKLRQEFKLGREVPKLGIDGEPLQVGDKVLMETVYDTPVTVTLQDIRDALLPRITLNPRGAIGCTLSMEDGKIQFAGRFLPRGRLAWLQLESRFRKPTINSVAAQLRDGKITLKDALEILKQESITDATVFRNSALSANIKWYGTRLESIAHKLSPKTNILRLRDRLQLLGWSRVQSKETVRAIRQWVDLMERLERGESLDEVTMARLGKLDQRFGNKEIIWMEEAKLDGQGKPIIIDGVRQTVRVPKWIIDKNHSGILTDFVAFPGKSINFYFHKGIEQSVQAFLGVYWRYKDSLIHVARTFRLSVTAAIEFYNKIKHVYGQLGTAWANIQDIREGVKHAESWEEMHRLISRIHWEDPLGPLLSTKAEGVAHAVTGLQAGDEEIMSAFLTDAARIQAYVQQNLPKLGEVPIHVSNQVYGVRYDSISRRILVGRQFAQEWGSTHRKMRMEGVLAGWFPKDTEFPIATLAHELGHWITDPNVPMAVRRMTPAQYTRLWQHILLRADVRKIVPAGYEQSSAWQGLSYLYDKNWVLQTRVLDGIVVPQVDPDTTYKYIMKIMDFGGTTGIEGVPRADIQRMFMQLMSNEHNNGRVLNDLGTYATWGAEELIGEAVAQGLTAATTRQGKIAKVVMEYMKFLYGGE